MQLTLLGTAVHNPSGPGAGVPAVTVQGHTLLLDCGEGTQVSLRKYGVSSYRIDAVLLTHYHGDHILGLPGLLQTLASLNRTAPLTIYGPPGQESIAAAIMALAGPLPYPVAWKIAEGTCKEAGLTVTPFPLKHRVPCCGYRLHLPRAGRFDAARAKAAGIPLEYWRVLQAGQSIGRLCAGRRIRPAPPGADRGVRHRYPPLPRRAGSCPGRGPAVHGLDLRRRHRPAQGETLRPRYLSGDRALAAEAKVRRLWLTHYSAAVTDPAPGLAAARTQYPEAAAGYDGLQLELEFDEG